MEANLVLERSFLKNKGLLVETFANVLTESKELDPTKIEDTIEKAGGDPDDVETAKNFLEDLISGDFDPSKIKLDDVIDEKNVRSENRVIQESGGHGGVGVLIHHAIEYMENSETGVQFSEWMTKTFGKYGRSTADVIIKGLHLLEKILNFIPDILSKGIYKIIRFFGGSIQTAKGTSNLGDVIWICVLGFFAITFFPSWGSFAIGAGLIYKTGAFLLKIWNLGRTIWRGIKEFISGGKEFLNREKYDASEFFQTIEPIWKALTPGLGSRGFALEWVKTLDDYIYKLKDEKREQFLNRLKKMTERIKSGKFRVEGFFDGLIQYTRKNKKVNDILKNMKPYFDNENINKNKHRLK